MGHVISELCYKGTSLKESLGNDHFMVIFV